MKFSLVICTYKRAQPLLRLLESVALQTLYPSEILIIDGSPDEATKKLVETYYFSNLIYYQVKPEERGLTKQRNFGVNHVQETSEIICFLDDDTVLENDYFEQIIKTFIENSFIVGVGGVAVNENRWLKKDDSKKYNNYKYYEFDGYVCRESQRNVIRNFFKLNSSLGPGRMPESSHGRTCGFPLNSKIYEVDLLVGMSFSFRKLVFNQIGFSTYFEGYGLYEDADFSIRAQRLGLNVINTNAKLAHFHDAAGRPNQYHYGKMVVRNGYYVWRVKYPKPSVKAKLKWHTTTLLLTIIRLTNILKGSGVSRKEAFTETIGRAVGWISLLFNQPKPNTT